MYALADGTDSAPVENIDRAAKIRERLDALGISDREFEAQTGVDRKALRRAASGAAVRGSTYTAIETWLTRLERRSGEGLDDLPEGFEYVDPDRRFISVQVGEGAGIVVFKAPIENADVAREQAEKFMERSRCEAETKREQP